MLVQKHKSKKRRALYNKTTNSLTQSQKLSSGMMTNGDLDADDKMKTEDDGHVDEKYRDFHRNRQSERILRVIRSVLDENRGSFAGSTTAGISTTTTRGKKESVGGDCRTKKGPNGNTPDEQQVHFNDPQVENENLKSQLCLAYDYPNSSSKANTAKEGRREEINPTKEFEAGKQCGEASVTCVDCETLYHIITQLKIDCLQERTEKEMLRLNVVKLHKCFGAVKEEYDTLQEKLEEMEVSCNKRLNKADDDIHKIKHCATKRKSIFGKLF